MLVDGPDGKPVPASTTHLRTVNVWPVGAQFLPGPWDTARQPLSVLGAHWSPGWVTLRPYDGCGHWASRPMFDGNEIYVQSFVPVPGDGCAGYNPLPVLGFSLAEPGPKTVFGGTP